MAFYSWIIRDWNGKKQENVEFVWIFSFLLLKTTCMCVCVYVHMYIHMYTYISAVSILSGKNTGGHLLCFLGLAWGWVIQADKEHWPSKGWQLELMHAYTVLWYLGSGVQVLWGLSEGTGNVWKTGISRETLLLSIAACKEALERWGSVSSPPWQ